MGVSGSILKRREDIDIDRLINDINLAANRAGLEITMDEKVYSKDRKEFKYVTFNILDSDREQEVLLYLFNVSEYDYDEEFDWIAPGDKLIHIINIEDFDSCEKLMLDFIYEYLFINRRDIFWDEQDWFYNYDSIRSIKNKEFDNEWCYKPFAQNEVLQ